MILISWKPMLKKQKKCERTPLLLRHPPSPKKSFSLTSCAHTGATQSIQTTRRSSQKQKQVSLWCSKNNGFTWSWSPWAGEDNAADRWRMDVAFAWMYRRVSGFQVLAELRPEDDGGRFLLYLWILQILVTKISVDGFREWEHHLG